MTRSWKTPSQISAAGAGAKTLAPNIHEFRMAVNGVATMTTADKVRDRAIENIMRFARMCAEEGEIAVEEHVDGGWRPFDMDEEARRREEAAEAAEAEAAAGAEAAETASEAAAEPAAEQEEAPKPKLAINFAPPE